VIFPSLSISICSAAGTLGRPGIVKIFPVLTTINPAPAFTLTSDTLILKFLGAPKSAGLS